MIARFGLKPLSFRNSKFPKLKKASFKGGQQQSRLRNVNNTGTNQLESFHICIFNTEWVINPDNTCSSNIKNLELYCSVNVPSLFEDLTTTFPLIEKARIGSINVLDRMKASNYHLKSLDLSIVNSLKKIYVDCPNLNDFSYSGLVLEELYIDCPKLIYFRYSGCKKIPTFIYLNVPTTIQTSIRFNFSVPSGINSSWFISLNKFVEMIGVHQHVYLHLDVCRLELVRAIVVSDL